MQVIESMIATPSQPVYDKKVTRMRGILQESQKNEGCFVSAIVSAYHESITEKMMPKLGIISSCSRVLRVSVVE